jgi:hypothetical protein
MHEIRLLLKKDLLILFNNIKLILRNPARLLPYAAFLIYISVMSSLGRRAGEEEARSKTPKLEDTGLDQVDFEIQNVVGGITLLALIILLYQLYLATKKNVSFFKMADVNFLFPAPVNPSNILLYYMVRSIVPAFGASLFFVVYLAIQISDSLKLDWFGLSYLILGLTFFIFMMMPIRFLVYTLHTRFGAMKQIRIGVFILSFILGLMILIPGLMGEKFWQGMFAWIASPWFDYFPLVGWSRGIIGLLFHKNLLLSTSFLLLYVLTYFVILKLVIKFSGFYYEDVLDATKSNEENKEKVQGKKEIDEGMYSVNSNKKLEIKDFGVGASAIFWRNYVHSSRMDFHPLFGIYSLVLAGIGILFAGLSHFDWFSIYVFYGYLIFILLIYFGGGMGKNNVGDLKKPFFILLPSSWRSKFWNLIKLDFIQMLLFATVLIVPSVLIAGLNLGLIPVFLVAISSCYLTGLSVGMIPKIGFEEGWDQKLFKPILIILIVIFGILPVLALSVIVGIIASKLVWGLFVFAIGMSIVAAILLHVTLDVIKRLEFKEV